MKDIDEIEREIKAASLEYIRELPGRFLLLIKQVEQLKQGYGDPAAAKGEAHKIKGTASSYGVCAVGDQAVIIDDCLKKICKNPDEIAPETWANLDAALKEAARLADEAVKAVADEA